MTIPPFWAGVLCTAFCELLALFILVIIAVIRSDINDKNNKERN